MCSSSAHDTARSSHHALPEWSNGHGKCFKALQPLETADSSAILRQSVVGFGLETHILRMCAAPAHTIQLEVPTMRTRMVQWAWKVFPSASPHSDNRSECYIESRAQSVVGFGLETPPFKVCAAPAHTIQLEVYVVTMRYQNGPMDMESVSKCFGRLRQPIQVLY